ncbi:MAG: beta-glucuronidase, partial [Firmicutes bacterium]|nr:beta-glucuronidase [Bacillota bacterium]
MVRLFQRHHKRNTRLLDGLWQFKIDPDLRGVKEEWFNEFPADHQSIIVPSCWNHELGLYHYEGVAWYQTFFETNSPQVNLVFHGFYGQIKVYVDGQHIGGQYGGFAGFECLVTGLEPGKHQLVVMTDNTHNHLNTIPLARVDWFHYGGLFRSVEIMELADVWIKDYQIDYQLDANLTNAEIKIQVTLESFNGLNDCELTVSVNGERLYNQAVLVDQQTTIQVEEKLTNIKLWSPEQPELYLIKLEIGQDDLVERIGFRDLKVTNGKILLNNQELYLKGVNRHEDHPDWGFAMPLKLMKKDLDIIKQLGCNTIRGSHYPNAPVFLDLLDQEGFLFWEEIPMWGFGEEALADPLTLERGLQMHQQMIKRDYHHPSIIIWGLHNEIDS